MHIPLLAALGIAFSLHAFAQSLPAPGLRLFGTVGGTDTWLVDDHGAVVHGWPSAFRPGTSVYLLDDGSLLRTIASASPPAGLTGAGGGIQRIAFDGRVLWDLRFGGVGFLSHHDIAPLPNGNVLMTVWEDKTPAEAIAAGRDPALIAGPVFRPDSIYEIQPTGPTKGAVVWSWHVFDHLIQDFDPAQANFGVVADHPERIDVNHPPVAGQAFDWNHCNGIDHDPVHDWIVLSAPNQNEIWIIDHGTTIAQAQGHTGGRWGKGGDLLYRWGNPAVWRAGTANDQQLFFQHDPRFVPPGLPGAGHLTVFDNGFAPNHSAAIELVLPLDQAGNFVRDRGSAYGPVAPLWIYTAPGFHSAITSSVQRLANGNTLICSGAQARLFEVTFSGAEVWSFTQPGNPLIFHAHYVERSLWADRDSLSVAGGGTVGFDLVAGSRRAGDAGLLLGSFTGTSPGFVTHGIHVPLNFDLFTDYTAAHPNSGMLVGTLRTLSPVGAGRAAFALPAGLAPPALVGLRLDFAYLVADPVSLLPRAASTTVPVTLLP